MSDTLAARPAPAPGPPNLTSARPTPRHYRAALTVGLLLALVTTLSLPYAWRPGPYVPAFLPMYAALASAADLVTAYLLFGQFLSSRTPALAALAASYLYSGTIILPYLLTFPRVFAPQGLLGAGPQTAVWLWTCWHAGFPLGLLFYAVLDGRYRQLAVAPATARRLAGLIIALVPTLVALLAVVAIRAERHLPVLVQGTHFTALFSLASPLGLTLCGLATTACAVLLARARGRSASVAGVWLTVAAFACLLDIAINVWVPSRYTVGWYVSRANTLMSAGIVLVALLYEVTRLYARLTQANTDLHESEQRLRLLSDAHVGQNRALLDAIPDMIVRLSANGDVLDYKMAREDADAGADEAAARQALLGRHISAVVPAALAQQVLHAAAEARHSGTVQTIDYALPRRGETHHYEARIVACGDTETMAIVRDITVRKRLEDSLWHQALHDALTGLPNRTLLQERLQQGLGAAQRERTPLALLLLDLDRFKDINDTFGHPQGDVILQQVAVRLREAVRATDLVARLGGDEFAVLLPATTQAQAQHVAHALWTALDAPLVANEQAFQVGASIGLATFPAHGQDAETLLRHADVAMYAAKRDGSGCTVYDSARDQHSPERLSLVADLRQALECDALLLHYQPKVAVASGRVCGVEALVRWPHPQRGFIPPDQFIALAEHTGLIKPLTWRVLDLALQQCAAWRRTGHPLEVAVNLSMANLHDPQLVGTILALLERYAVPPSALRLELTASSVMADMEQSLAVLTRLSRHGVRLSIDDFGTGYSSLAYLKRLPVDEIKIDKSFVQHMATEDADAAIVRSVIALGHALGLAVVAEGVEDVAAWDLLAAEGCEVAQGYYLSRPLPAPELERWLRESGWGQDRVSA